MTLSDLHGVRATVEAFSRSRRLEIPKGEPLASGLMFTPNAGTSWEVLRVTSQGAVATYTLDRWD